MEREAKTTPESVFDDRQPTHDRARQSRSGLSGPVLWSMVIGISLLTGVGGFIGGLQVGKSSSTTTTASTTGQMGGQQGGPSQGMGTMGTVTAISSDSITVKDTMQNTTKTYSITSSTTVTDSGSASTVSAIKTGDTVMVQTGSSSSSSSSSSSDSSVATTIQLNPTAPTGGPGNSFSNSSSATN